MLNRSQRPDFFVAMAICGRKSGVVRVASCNEGHARSPDHDLNAEISLLRPAGVYTVHIKANGADGKP